MRKHIIYRGVKIYDGDSIIPSSFSTLGFTSRSIVVNFEAVSSCTPEKRPVVRCHLTTALTCGPGLPRAVRKYGT